MSQEVTDRLFVPLKTGPYWAFESGSKTWELRGVNDRFNRSTVRVGRRVELRRGYNTADSLWGTITARMRFASAEEIPFYRSITPGKTRQEFLASVDDMLGQYDEFVAFRVEVGHGGE